MILYHGSNTEVKNPKIIKSIEGKDFGHAFYLTPIKSQAEKMAIRKTKYEHTGTPVVSIFEWDGDVSKLKYKKLEKPDEEWLDLVVTCRTNPSYCHHFDLVEGKIADDRVGYTVSLLIRGYLDKQAAIKQLRFQQINSQLAFCTKKSLSTLKFIRSYKV